MRLQIKTILLASPDWTKSNNELLVKNLQGIQILHAEDTQTCLEILSSKPVDLLIVDEDLTSLLENIKNLNRDIKPGMVLVICDEENIPIWENMIPGTRDEFFKKPVRFKKLVRFIKLYLAGKYSDQYETIFNAMPYGGEILNLDGIIEEVSAKTCELLGYNKAELLGKSYSTLLDKKSLPLFEEGINQIEHLKTMSHEVDLRCKNGKLIPVLRSSRLIQNDRDPADSKILALNLEISDLRIAQDALKESEQNFRTFFEQATDAFMLVDEEGTIIAWNRQARI